MAGLTPYSIEESDNFKRSFKKLVKFHGRGFVDLVVELLENLIEDPYPLKSRREPTPGKLQLPEEWTFHKLEFTVSKGASGQIRLMYLVNEDTCVIRTVWIYSHEQFVKRPSDKDLKAIIEELLDS